jgi:hypothetical protein
VSKCRTITVQFQLCAVEGCLASPDDAHTLHSRPVAIAGSGHDWATLWADTRPQRLQLQFPHRETPLS